MKTLSIQEQFNLILNGFKASTIVLNSTMAVAFSKAGITGVEFAPTFATKKRSKKVIKTPIKATRKSSYKGSKAAKTVAPVLSLPALALAKGKELLRTLGRKIQGTLTTIQAEVLCLNIKEVEKSIAFSENKGGNLSNIRQALSALKEAVCL